MDFEKVSPHGFMIKTFERYDQQLRIELDRDYLRRDDIDPPGDDVIREHLIEHHQSLMKWYENHLEGHADAKPPDDPCHGPEKVTCLHEETYTTNDKRVCLFCRKTMHDSPQRCECNDCKNITWGVKSNGVEPIRFCPFTGMLDGRPASRKLLKAEKE
jgi:hypothetical protein